MPVFGISKRGTVDVSFRISRIPAIQSVRALGFEASEPQETQSARVPSIEAPNRHESPLAKMSASSRQGIANVLTAATMAQASKARGSARPALEPRPPPEHPSSESSMLFLAILDRFVLLEEGAKASPRPLGPEKTIMAWGTSLDQKGTNQAVPEPIWNSRISFRVQC